MPRSLFVSSTVADLELERATLKSYIEKNCPVSITCSLSEASDFPVAPRIVGAHPYEIALENLRQSSFVLQLLNRRYGVPDIEDGGRLISIGHKEYREAFRLRLPTYSFVRRELWDAYCSWRRGEPQSYVPDDQLGLFDLLDESQATKRNKWLFFWSGVHDIETQIEAGLFHHDESKFVADVTVPDGTTVEVGERFEKVWELENAGFVTWHGRWLREENPGNGLVPENAMVRIAHTEPGNAVQIAVRFQAPKYPATCESLWKMVDASGRYFLPWMKGIRCLVRVVY